MIDLSAIGKCINKTISDIKDKAHERADYNYTVYKLTIYFFTASKAIRRIRLINAVKNKSEKINKYIANKSLNLSMKATSRLQIHIINAIKDKYEKINKYIANKSLDLTIKLSSKLPYSNILDKDS